jgi:hypothetical protein
MYKDIPGYENLYKVDEFGKVLSISKGWKQKSCSKDSGGYDTYDLYKNGIRKKYKSSQLVAMTYLNHVPCGYTLVVDHIDNNKDNNHLSNLQIVTSRKNSSKDKINKTSRYTGVYFDKPHNKWRADIRTTSGRKFLGYFNSQEDASNCYENNLAKIEHI